MSKNRSSINEVEFRPANPNDAKVAGNLLFETFPKKAAYIIGLGCEGRARKILSDVFQIPGHRLSYEFTQMVIHNKKVIGAMVTFPGSELGKLDRGLYLPILRQYKFPGKLKLIRRAFPLIFIKETTPNEYFLSNLVVKRPYRNKGIGEIMLHHVEELATDAGLSKIALIVNLENQKARRFYDRNGYEIKAMNLFPNRQVPNLGPGSERRVKAIN
jgi:ribosomal protein S18 acetylase RimI-like enzyme